MSVLNTIRDKVVAMNNLLQSDLIRNVLINHDSDIMELQQIQLLQGKASNGEDIRPYYSEDLKPSGYFHSVDSAGRYSAWKDGLPYPYSVSRNPDAPNLYINGKFHSELGVEFLPDEVGIVPTTSYATRIVNKYGLKTFGLQSDYWNIIFRERGALSELINEIRNMLL